MSAAGLYVHFPYCEQKCPYCDFNVHAIPHDDRAYSDAILRELEARGPAYGDRFATIYFGGGTPSEWDPTELARVIRAVKREDGSAEITLETNPGTVAESRIEAFARAGVNRFSIGAQSFLDRELETLGRTHHASEIARAVSAAKATGARVSIDLIYAIPGQTEDDVVRSIDRALELGVDHLSAYTLTIETDTPLGKRTRLGLFNPMDDDLQASMIERVTARLGEAGFERYEVSSYAPPGNEAVHNSLYWKGRAYLGLGAGAHSYLPAASLSGAIRRENVRAPAAYLESPGKPSFEEALDADTVVGERLMLGLRTKFGIDLSALSVEARRELGPTALARAEPLIAGGLVVYEGTVLRPTPRGFLFSDLIARHMLG